MDFRDVRSRQGVYWRCTTARCDLACASCLHCRKVEPQDGWDREPSGVLDPKIDRLRLHGGDPFRYGDLSAWVGWARQSPRVSVEVEGPAASLGGEDSDAVLERLARAAPDVVCLVLPTVDADRTGLLTGRTWSPVRALDSAAKLARTRAVSVVVPVNTQTVAGVYDVVMQASERVADVDIVLRRAPERRSDPRRLPLLEESGWAELPELSRQIARLPASLPGSARLFMDQQRGYPACMLAPEARRPDLVAARADARTKEAAPLGAICGSCAWKFRCTWHPGEDKPLLHQVMPLGEEDALALQSEASDESATHVPHARRQTWSRADLGLPELLCVAPWTSFAPNEPDLHPVPCALSWVKNEVELDAMADVLGEPRAQVAAREAAARASFQGPSYSLANETLSLDELWNNPLMRIMRRQMFSTLGASSHCRSMCRVVMGVEDRGASLLARPDADLTPAIIENRRRLLEEVRAGHDRVRARPLELILGVAGSCNITCGFCNGPDTRLGELTDLRRDQVIEWLPTLMSFSVSGPGEPLMSRNYLALLAHVADGAYPALEMCLTTNGTLLTPAFLKRHARVRWSHVRISLNAGSASTHERMTGQRLFDRVRENLDALCALRDASHPRFQVTLSCVLSKTVMGDLHAFAKLVTDYDAYVVVEPMYGDSGGLSPWTRPALLSALADELLSVADAYTLRNPALSKAFRAVETFARARLASGATFVLAQH